LAGFKALRALSVLRGRGPMVSTRCHLSLCWTVAALELLNLRSTSKASTMMRRRWLQTSYLLKPKPTAIIGANTEEKTAFEKKTNTWKVLTMIKMHLEVATFCEGTSSTYLW
jgi:hypothetical protein